MVSESLGGFEQFLECNRIFNFSSLFDLNSYCPQAKNF